MRTRTKINDQKEMLEIQLSERIKEVGDQLAQYNLSPYLQSELQTLISGEVRNLLAIKKELLAILEETTFVPLKR